MLVLGRQQGEAIVIRVGGRKVCVVSVRDLHKTYVRLGFEATPDVEINRIEVDAQEYPGDLAAGPGALPDEVRRDAPRDDES